MKVAAASAVLLAAVTALLATAASATPLDDYVALEDNTFSYTDRHISWDGNGYTIHLYNLTSQKWLTAAETNRPIWWHTLAVVIPFDVDPNHDSSIMYITGSDNSNPDWVPKHDDEDLAIAALLAVQTRTTGAVLFQVPNQPITFADDPWHKPNREEDAAIALTWWHYTVDPSRPFFVLELPMTKAAVRALDALELILPKYTDGRIIKKFIVAGASKRGWTTWLLGAVEQVSKKRVIAIIPIVLDALNVQAFLHRQWRFYGAWTFALVDYYNCSVTRNVDNPNFKRMLTFIDPFFYRDRLTMPKLAINAGGDEFQMPDDYRYWVRDMVGEMHLLLIKNAEHSLITGIFEVIQGAGAFISSVQANGKRPSVQWAIDNVTGRISIAASEPPISVDVTYSDSGLGVSAGRRDFRWAALNTSICIVKVFGACVRPLFWETTTEAGVLHQISATEFTALPSLPPKGWRAFTIEVQFKNPYGVNNFLMTVPASVIPNNTPFPDCTGEGCYGTLC